MSNLEAFVEQVRIDVGVQLAIGDRYLDSFISHDDSNRTHCVSMFVSAFKADKTVRIPLDWWQALKLRWFPGWLKRWMPMRWKGVVLETRWCPHAERHTDFLYPKEAMLDGVPHYWSMERQTWLPHNKEDWNGIDH